MKKEAYGRKAEKKVRVFNNFKGVDYAHAAANISPHRSVNGLNMVRSEVGKVCKRTGYEFDSHQWTEQVNGVHFLVKDDESICLVHSGTAFYVEGRQLFSGAADHCSCSVQIGNMLYILDGANFMAFDGSSIGYVKDMAYVPLVYSGRAPGGGGTACEQVNLLTAYRRESFIADGASKVYSLSQPQLDSSAVTAVIYSDDGTYYTVTTGNGCTVDAVTGTVTFDSAPPLSKLKDQDNVYITYEKSSGIDVDILDKCTVMAVFGAGGRPDTLFLSGHPDYPGREWFSQPNNPAFFGVNNTDLAGSDRSPVIGYSTRGDKLFVHRKNNERRMNILVRSCSGGDENNYFYPVTNALHGESAVSDGGFVNMANDSLFLTQKGIYAITKNDATQDHITQMRSFYINSRLAKTDLSQASAVAYNDFYVVAVGNDIFLLDTLQKSYETDKEYSQYQYECYHWQLPVSVRLLFVQDGRLCFVTDDGRTGRFFTDYDNPQSFNDAGQAITAIWQTGDFTADITYRIKNIYRIWVVCAVALRTGVRVQAQIKGIWTDLFSDMTTARFFQWSAIQWSKFTWSTDKTPKIMKKSVRIRNTDKTAFRLENSNLNEPFGIYELGFEYLTGSYYR